MPVALLFTDIESSTRLVQELGERYPAALEGHRAQVRAAVAALDGRLEVVSPVGGGTRVHATLPLVDVREAVPQEAG